MAEFETLSVGTSLGNADDLVEDISSDQLELQLNNIIRANEVLQLETHMFEKHLWKLEPNIKNNNLSNRDKTSSSSHSSLSDQVVSSRMGRRWSKSRSISSVERVTKKLSADQKCAIVQRELDDERRQHQVYQQNNDIIIDNLVAVLEEDDFQMIEIKNEFAEFGDFLKKDPTKKLSKKTMADKFVKHLEEKVREKEAMIVKLRLKNESLKNLEKKLNTQLRQKEESGDGLEEVDLSELRVDNQQLQNRIQQLNTKLLSLKVIAGKANQALSICKGKLCYLEKESTELTKDLKLRTELQHKIEIENIVVSKEKHTSEILNASLKDRASSFVVPSVLEFVAEKMTRQQLLKDVHLWQRKVQINEMKLIKLNKMQGNNLTFAVDRRITSA